MLKHLLKGLMMQMEKLMHLVIMKQMLMHFLKQIQKQRQKQILRH